MKRKVWIIITALILAALLAGFCVELYKGFSVTTFSAADYEDEILHFTEQTQIKTEPINSRADAVRAADALWMEYYLKPENFYQKQVSYDEAVDCWMVHGLMWKSYFMQHNPFIGFSGGSVFIIISSDGEVLAAWREF